jgi:hypothetical protein
MMLTWANDLLNNLNSYRKMRQLQSSRFIPGSIKTRTSCICIQSLGLIISPSGPEYLYAFVIIVIVIVIIVIVIIVMALDQIAMD